MGLSKAVKVLLIGLVLNTLTEGSNDIRSSSFCTADCYSRNIDPTCGSDNQLYMNMCDIEMHNCRLKAQGQALIRAVPWSFCSGVSCLRACTREFDPVCGEDGHIASNPCTFLWYHVCEKKKPIREVPMTVCLKSKCPYNCNPQDTACLQTYNKCKFFYGFG